MQSSPASKICHVICRVIEQEILPALNEAAIKQVLVNECYRFEPAEIYPISEDYLPNPDIGHSAIVWEWSQKNMVISRFPYLMLIYRGVADYKIGVTTEMAQERLQNTQEKLAGRYLLRLPAPGIIYSAPTFPRNIAPSVSGIGVDYRSFCLFIMENNIRFHLSGTMELASYVTHFLQLQSPSLAKMAEFYLSELKANQKESARAQLFVLMNRLHRMLEKHRPSLGNSAWTTLPNIYKNEATSQREREICQEAVDYIEARLSLNLNRGNIARKLSVTPDHLGRVFFAVTGMTLMDYVTNRRLEAAKLMLTNGRGDTISEIAQLVGFSNTASFSAAFKRATGMPPSVFRQRHTDE